MPAIKIHDLAWKPRGQFIGGEFLKGTGPMLKVHSPSTGELICEFESASTKDLNEAVTRASSAWPEWFNSGPLHRSRVLREAASILRAHESELAHLDAIDCGNPISGMRFDVTLGTTLLDYFAGLTAELKGETIPQLGNKLTYVSREPVGVVSRLVPFNHPFMFAAAKIAAPLAAGNAVILKPSEETPLSALRMVELIAHLFPDGLLSILVGGPEIGKAISQHPGISSVGLIGSVETGKAVMEAGAKTLKRVQLELGGKNALIICPDADISKAISGAVKGMNLGWTAGQSCGSTSRIFVHSKHYEQVVKEVSASFDGITVGDPANETTQMGCLSTKRQFDKTLGFIERAIKAGATISTKRHYKNESLDGFFVNPTVISGIDHSYEIAREEVFGPVLSIIEWTDIDEMLSEVNGLNVGLTASIWTQDISMAMNLSKRISAGYVWINDSSDHYLGAPFGGVKDSGLGREECLEEMYSYTNAKTVTIVT